MYRHVLSQREWSRLEPLLPPKSRTVTRFYRWTRSGLWNRILAELRREADAAGGIDWEVHMVDGTSVRAHRCAAGGKGGRKRKRWAAAVAASAASCTSGATERVGPMAFVLTPGERNEKAVLPVLMNRGAVKRPGRGRPKLRPKVHAAR